MVSKVIAQGGKITDHQYKQQILHDERFLELGTQPRQRLLVQALAFPPRPFGSQYILIIVFTLEATFLVRSEWVVLIILVALSSRLLPRAGRRGDGYTVGGDGR